LKGAKSKEKTGRTASGGKKKCGLKKRVRVNPRLDQRQIAKKGLKKKKKNPQKRGHTGAEERGGLARKIGLCQEDQKKEKKGEN